MKSDNENWHNENKSWMYHINMLRNIPIFPRRQESYDATSSSLHAKRIVVTNNNKMLELH